MPNPEKSHARPGASTDPGKLPPVNHQRARVETQFPALRVPAVKVDVQSAGDQRHQHDIAQPDLSDPAGFEVLRQLQRRLREGQRHKGDSDGDVAAQSQSTTALLSQRPQGAR